MEGGEYLHRVRGSNLGENPASEGPDLKGRRAGRRRRKKGGRGKEEGRGAGLCPA